MNSSAGAKISTECYSKFLGEFRHLRPLSLRERGQIVRALAFRMDDQKMGQANVTHQKIGNIGNINGKNPVNMGLNYVPSGNIMEHNSSQLGLKSQVNMSPMVTLKNFRCFV